MKQIFGAFVIFALAMLPSRAQALQRAPTQQDQVERWARESKELVNERNRCTTDFCRQRLTQQIREHGERVTRELAERRRRQMQRQCQIVPPPFVGALASVAGGGPMGGLAVGYAYWHLCNAGQR